MWKCVKYVHSKPDLFYKCNSRLSDLDTLYMSCLNPSQKVEFGCKQIIDESELELSNHNPIWRVWCGYKWDNRLLICSIADENKNQAEIKDQQLFINLSDICDIWTIFIINSQYTRALDIIKKLEIICQKYPDNQMLFEAYILWFASQDERMISLEFDWSAQFWDKVKELWESHQIKEIPSLVQLHLSILQM